MYVLFSLTQDKPSKWALGFHCSPLQLIILKFTNICQSGQPANQSEVFWECDETAWLYFLRIKAPVCAFADFNTVLQRAECFQTSSLYK